MCIVIRATWHCWSIGRATTARGATLHGKTMRSKRGRRPTVHAFEVRYSFNLGAYPQRKRTDRAGRQCDELQTKFVGGLGCKEGCQSRTRSHRSGVHRVKRSSTHPCILDFVLFIEHDGGRLWSLWAKAGAVGNAQRCPRQARRCAAGASSTNPQPASVWRRSSTHSWGGLSTPRLSSERGAISSSVARTVAWAHPASCRCSPQVRQGWAYE